MLPLVSPTCQPKIFALPSVPVECRHRSAFVHSAFPISGSAGHGAFASRVPPPATRAHACARFLEYPFVPYRYRRHSVFGLLAAISSNHGPPATFCPCGAAPSWFFVLNLPKERERTGPNETLGAAFCWE